MKAFMSKRVKALLNSREGRRELADHMLNRAPGEELWKPITDAQRNGEWFLVRGPDFYPNWAMCDRRYNGGVRMWHRDNGGRLSDEDITQFLDLPSLREFAPR